MNCNSSGTTTRRRRMLPSTACRFSPRPLFFANEIIERIDDREDYGELRFIALGRVEMEIYRVAYTWRGEKVIRIINAQKASKHEQEIYYRELFT